MSVSTNILLVTNTNLKKTQEAQNNLTIGDKLKGRITKIKPDGNAEIEIEGKFKTEARLDFPVKEGDSLNFIVLQKGKQLVLKLDQMPDSPNEKPEGRIQEKPQNIKHEQLIINHKIKESPGDEIEVLKEIKKVDKQIIIEDKIRNSLDKLKNAQNSESLLKEIKDILKNLKSYTSESEISDKIKQSLNNLKIIIVEMEKIQNTIQDHAKSLDQGYQLSDKMTSTAIQISNSPIAINKSVIDLIVSLADNASGISSINSVEQLPEIRESIESLASKLFLLENIINERSGELPKELKQNIELTQEFIKDLQSDMKRLLSQLPEDSQMRESIINLTQSVKKIINDFTDSGELSRTVRNDLLKLLSILEPVSINQEIMIEEKTLSEDKQFAPKNIQDLSHNLRNMIQNLQKDLKILSQDLSKNMIESGKTEILAQNIENIRSDLSGHKEYLEIVFRLIGKMDELNTAIDKSDLFPQEDREKILAQFAEAANKLEQIKSINNIYEIRDIIKDKIEPVISFMNKFLKTQAVEGQIDQQHKIENIKLILNEIKTDLNELLAKIPEKSEQWRTISKLLENIENLTKKISEDNKLSANTSKLIEKIQFAVDKLKAGSATHGNLTEVSDRFRELINKLTAQVQRDNSLDNLDKLLVKLQSIRGNSSDSVKESLDKIIPRLAEQSDIAKDPAILKNMQLNFSSKLSPILSELKNLLTVNNSSQTGDSRINTQSVQDIIKQLELSFSFISKTEDNATSTVELAKKTELLQNSFKNLPINNTTAKQNAGLINNLRQLLEPLLSHSDFSEKLQKAPMDMQQIMSRLDMFLKPLDIGGNINKLASQLQALIKDSGIFFEKNIEEVLEKITEASLKMPDMKELSESGQVKNLIKNDLKPNLLLLREYLNSGRLNDETTDQKMLKSIKSTIEDMLSNVDKQQANAVENRNSQSSIQSFSFAVPLDGENEPLKFTVFYNKKGKESNEDGFLLSLLLALEPMGEVRGDFFLIKKNLNITIYVKNRKIKSFVADQIESLKKTLNNDFENLNVQILIHKKTQPPIGMDKNQESIISDKKVDVKI